MRLFTVNSRSSLHIIKAQLAPGSSTSHLGHETRAARQRGCGKKLLFLFRCQQSQVTLFARLVLNGLRITSAFRHISFCHRLVGRASRHHITLSIYRILQSTAEILFIHHHEILSPSTNTSRWERCQIF
jgi:hypothetical protein